MNGRPPLFVAILTYDSILGDELSQVIRHSRDLRFLGVFQNVDALLRAFPSDGSGVAVVDLDLPGMAAIPSVIQVKAQRINIKVFVLCDLCDPELVLKAFRAGADGCSLKQESSQNIVSGIAESINGGSLISAIVTRSHGAELEEWSKTAPQCGLAQKE